MIVWINGAYGSGKSSVAKKIQGIHIDASRPIEDIAAELINYLNQQ